MVDVLDTLLAISLSLIYLCSCFVWKHFYLYLFKISVSFSDVNRYFHLDFVCMRLKIVFFFDKLTTRDENLSMFA